MPFSWGLHDCCTFGTNWCVENGHTDPMARWRHNYTTEDGADALIASDHGLEQMWLLGMIDAQIPECDEARLGDVGLVRAHATNGVETVAAIYGGRRWHMLSHAGLYCASIAPEHVIRTWRV